MIKLHLTGLIKEEAGKRQEGECYCSKTRYDLKGETRKLGILCQTWGLEGDIKRIGQKFI